MIFTEIVDTSPVTWAAEWGVGLLKPPPAHRTKLPCMRGISNGWLIKVAITRMMRRRRGVLMFRDNVDFIQTFDTAGNMPYKLGVNALADMTHEEFRASDNTFKFPPNSRTSIGKNIIQAPECHQNSIYHGLEKEKNCHPY